MSEKTIKLLMIEDEPDFIDLVRHRFFQEHNPSFDVEEANTLKGGIERLKQGGIEAVLLDLSLPDSQGIDTLVRLCAEMPALPIVVSTGHNDESLALESLRRGAEDYIVKGQFDVKMFSRIVRYAIERHRIKLELDTANARLESLALLDPLTELLNRRGLQENLSREIQRAKREGSSFIVFLVDIDDFKQINDAMGHVVGDVVLKEIAHRLLASLRATDYVARIGGDEFMILLPQTRLAEALQVAERLRLTVSQEPISVFSWKPVMVTVSLGVATVLEETPSIDELLTKTHLALHKSKTRGKNQVSYEGKESKHIHQNGSSKSLDVLNALREGNQFQILMQPVIELATDKRIGYELLSHSSIRGFESPDDFFRLCLENNILTLVDHRCFKTCVAVGVTFPAGIRRHVNLFPSTLINIPLQHLLEALPANSPKGTYCIEISEQQIIGDPSYLIEIVNGLKRFGVLVAIDDVGFGRSCLESLILLEPDIIKIDKKCILGIAHDELLTHSLKRILKVAESLGTEIIAEGVERQEDLVRLKELGVKYAQGFLWGRPAKVSFPSELPEAHDYKPKHLRKSA